jgi:hypothetical protein
MIHKGRNAVVRMSPRVRAALAAMVVVALVLDFLFYTGFFASDDLQYLTGARGIARLLELHGRGSAIPGMGNARLGMTVPAGVVYWLSDGNVATVAWYHVIYHLLLVGLAFLLGRLFHGERAGLIAAAIAATCPVLYFFAGAILPDNVTAVWLAVILMLLELVRRREQDGPLPVRAAARWYVAIGFLVGVAYACKDTALIMTVPCAACVMASAPSLRHPVWIRNGAFMIAGLLAFLLVELVVLRAVTGEWIFRPSMVADVGDAFVERMKTQGGANPLARLWFGIDRLSSVAPVTIWILLAGALGYAFTPRRRLSLLLFFWWPFTYMTVGTTSFTAYRPSSIQTRYYGIVMVPAAVMTAIVAVELWRRWRESRAPRFMRGRAAIAVVALAAVTIVAAEGVRNAPRSGNIYKALQARALLGAYEVARDAHPQYPIVIGSSWGKRVKSILAGEDDERVFWLHDDDGPEPPYLLVGLANDPPPPDLAVELLDTVPAPASRFAVVAHELAGLFGLPPRAPREPHDFMIGTVRLVSRTAPTSPHHDVVGPWVPIGGSPRVRAIHEGAMVTWGRGDTAAMQHLEVGSHRRAPRDPRSRVSGGRTLRVTVPVRMLTGREARVTLGAYGYDSEGQSVAHGSAAASLRAGAAPSDMTVSLDAATPIASFRVRLQVSRPRRDGSLFAGHPRIDD